MAVRPAPTMHGLLSLVLSLTLSACGIGQAPTASPNTPASPAASAVAQASSGPVEAGPLPEPQLRTADEIVAALADPAQAEQVVVSMLALLGIGLYEPDGTPIRKGTETSDDDFFVFEPEARGLANLLRQRDDPEQMLSFREFHAALAGAGLEGSAEELAADYADSYAANPDAPMSRLVQGVTTIDVDGRVSQIGIWLLLLDGFVRPSTAVTAMAATGDRGWGITQASLLRPRGVPAKYAEMVQRLLAITATWTIVVLTQAAVHEGHGGSGTPIDVTAYPQAALPAFYSPFTGQPVTIQIPPGFDLEGLEIGWDTDSVADEHGSLALSRVDVGADGIAANAYTPNEEAANGQGVPKDETGYVGARFSKNLLLRLYGAMVEPYLPFIGGYVSTIVSFRIEWHEVAKGAIRIEWTDTYDGADDLIVFVGDLTKVVPDELTGGVKYVGTGTATGKRNAWTACNPGLGDLVWDGRPNPATFEGVPTGSGTIMISAYVDIGAQLAGIWTYPMEVSEGNDLAEYKSETFGDLCPHSSHGVLKVTGLVYPTSP